MAGSFCKAMSLPLCACYYCGQNIQTKEHSLLVVYDLTCTEHKVPVEIELGHARDVSEGQVKSR
jgi:hypothetical protein